MSTPDRTPEQPDPDTRQGPQSPQSPQSPLENEGWGTTDPANPFTEETRTLPWFRRPATLIGGAAVAVVVIVGLVIALVVTGKDAGSTEAGSTAATATSSAAAFSGANDELTYTDRQFLRGISPSIRRYATDEELLDQADYICSKLESSSRSEIQTALIDTGQQLAAWQGIDGPESKGLGEYTFSQELAGDAAKFMFDAEEAFCPGAFPDASTDLLS
jgi:hypothetical protein